MSPPRLLMMLLANLLPRAERDEVLADIANEYAARADAFGGAAARRWLWRQALGSVTAIVRWNWRREWTGFIPAANRYSPGGSMWRSWIADARYATRRLRARPGYAFLAMLALALGVGGTAAAYGVARGVLFDSLPFPNEREVGVFWKKTDWREGEFLFVRGRVPGFDQVALYRRGDVILRIGDEPAKLLPGVAASAELFDVLGARPLLGRGFAAGDDALGAEPVVVLSYGLWQEMGGDSSITGTRLTLNGTPRTVVGVMPRGFWFPDPSVRLWTPVPLSSEAVSWNSTLIGRVAPGHDVRLMNAPVAQLAAMLDERFDYPAQWDKTKNPLITPLRDDLLGNMRPAVRATLGTMGLILLIACANIAALMLGQVDARASELAVRSALGATRRRLTQQLVLEALLIAIAAGALGAVLARAGAGTLAGALPLGAWTDAPTPDWGIFASAMGIAMLAALLVVLVPTVVLWRGDLRAALGSGRTGGLEGRGGKMENGLVVAEVAVAVLIASGTALLLRSTANLYALDPGIRTEGAAVVDVTTNRSLNRDRKQQTIEELTAALAAVPGVQSAAATQMLPLRGGGYNLPLEIEGRSELEGLTTEYRIVTPGYLESLGFALRAGRTIAASDGRAGERVVVINEALATKYFAGVNPIGQRLGGDIGGIARVIGVVANAVERQLTDVAEPVRYVALAQMQWLDDAQSIVLRAAPGVDESSLLEPARRTIQRVAPSVAVQGTTTMRRVHDVAVGPARQVVTLLTLLTGLALTLGAVGIYGVIAHFAARRRRDWAIKVALGLPGSRVVAHVVGHGALLVGVGIGVGAIAASALARVLASMLYGVSSIDPFSYAGAGAALLSVGLIAALIPALRAGKLDPASVLREE
jgi:putative ABC transport system permease protein